MANRNPVNKFKKGVSGNPSGRPKGVVVPVKVPVSPQLAAMRKVFGQPEEDDKTPGEKTARMLLKTSPREYFQQLKDMEDIQRRAEELARQKSVDAAAVKAVADPGTAKVEELIDKLLSEWKGLGGERVA